jgi:hypothetical protein
MLVYFMAICSNLRPYGMVCGHFRIVDGHFVYLFPFWYICTEKNLATPVPNVDAGKKWFPLELEKNEFNYILSPIVKVASIHYFFFQNLDPAKI